MSKPALIAKFSPAQIAEAVEKVQLPPALQGFTEWAGSKDVGGNSTAHLASLNGKSQAIGVIQCFADIHFGTAAALSILSGIEKAELREAFRKALEDFPRLKEFHGKPLQAARALGFLRAFVRHGMEAATVKAPAPKPSIPAPAAVEKGSYPRLIPLNGGAAFGALAGEQVSGAFSPEFQGACNAIAADHYKRQAAETAQALEAAQRASQALADRQAAQSLPAAGMDYPALAADYIKRQGKEAAGAFLQALAGEFGLSLSKPRQRKAA